MAKSKKKKSKKRNPNKPRKTVYTYGIFSAPVIDPSRMIEYKSVAMISELMISSSFCTTQMDSIITDERVDYFRTKYRDISNRSWNDPGMIGNVIAKEISAINEICKKENTFINIRCEYNKHIYRVMTLNRGCLTNAGVDIEGLFIIRYDEDRNIAECCCLGTNGVATGFFGEAILFASPDSRIAENAAKEYRNAYNGINDNHFDPFVVAAIIYGIFEFTGENKENAFKTYHAGRLETDILKAIGKSKLKPGKDFPKMYVSLMGKYIPNSSMSENNVVKVYQHIEDLDEFNDADYPLLDMSDREINYINNYFSSYENAVDINTLFTLPRYGTKTRIESVDTDGNLMKLFMNVEIIGDDSARIIISTNVDSSSSLHTVVWLHNIDDYRNPAHNIAGTNIVLGINGIDGIISDVGEPLQKMHYKPTEKESIFEEDMYRLVHYLIKMYLVMHDRPKRYRMISVTKDPEDRPALYDPKKKQGSEEDDPKPYVIRRLLRPAKDAEEYVRQNNKNRKEVVYTMESWHRCGYWRRTKSGGKAYVPPTTCHRNLKVTKNTDIHIKL